MPNKHGTSEREFSGIVPKLKGGANWEHWKRCLRIALDAMDLSYWGILTGVEACPKDLFDPSADQFVDTQLEGKETPAPRPKTAAAITAHWKLQMEWDEKDATILTYVASTLDPLPSVKATKWINLRYKPGVKPEKFVVKWRLLMTEMQDAYPASQRVSPLFAIHMFLNAVANNTACRDWLNTVSPRHNLSDKHYLEKIFDSFITSEDRRLRNLHHESQHQQKPQSLLFYCAFHKRKVRH
ncbi:hypothetical protein N7501_003333 [Penicillium viridicatum]|nr:hypothetical protein N7501_003333 [Penicillium viridicatum]